ncbi:ATP-binding cassette domain-containing protein, partial [Nostoc sp. NIES-2111]
MQPGGKFALRLQKVTKAYGRVTALRDLSFEVEEGRFFALFGPSSVGKTTTLRTIAGLVIPDSGRVEIGGGDTTNAPIMRRGGLVVFQFFPLYPHLTLAENFAYPPKEAGGAPAAIKQRVGAAAEMVRLSHPPGRQP